MAEHPEGPKESAELLTPKQLAARWEMSVHTLENWRSAGRGPTHVKVGRLVRYRLPDVERFESENASDRERPAPEAGGE